MSYTALYNKYRPKTFDDVIGQKFVVDTLVNQIKNDQVAHAYIFSGTRGVGKTSIARILGHELNKEGISDNLNIIEIDAASNNGVDEIRNLKEIIKFESSGHRLIIIDEAHMLTIAAFNAMLKTLEESPDKTTFVLATTEPYKIPITIRSRCQHFEFLKISMDELKERVNHVAKNEEIVITGEALKEIALMADGSLRDSLTLLEQLSAISGKEIDEKLIAQTFGLVDMDVVRQFMDNLINSRYQQNLQLIEEKELYRKNLVNFIYNLVEELKLTYIQTSNEAIPKIIQRCFEIIKESKIISNEKFLLDSLVFIQPNEQATVTKTIEMPKTMPTSTTQVKEEVAQVEEAKEVETQEEFEYEFEEAELFEIFSEASLDAKKNALNKWDRILKGVMLSQASEDMELQAVMNEIEIKAATEDSLALVLSSEMISKRIIESDLKYKLQMRINDEYRYKIALCITNENEYNRVRDEYIKSMKSEQVVEVKQDAPDEIDTLFGSDFVQTKTEVESE